MKTIENFLFYAGIPVLLFFFLDLVMHYFLKGLNITEKSYHLFLIFYGISMLFLTCIYKIIEFFIKKRKRSH
jgi:predicted permease